MSHELRTPLTAIKGALSLLLNQISSDPAVTQNLLNVAFRNTQVLQNLVNDILDFEMMRQKGLAFVDSDVDLVALCKACIEQLETYAEQYGVTLKLQTSTDANLLWIKADSGRIAQVLFNLVSNAIKYSPREGMVTLTVKEEATKVHVGIQDQGQGFSNSASTKLFQYFSQIDSSDARKKGGTGLGLAISKAIIDHYQGEIGFESEPGKGAYFYFELDRSPHTTIP